MNRSFFIHCYLFTEAGCADGWIHKGLVFKGQQSTEDYHGEMNSEVFEEWVSLILKYHSNVFISKDQGWQHDGSKP